MKYRFLYLVIVLSVFLPSGIRAQNSIEIFADIAANDTLQKLVTSFTQQLQKSLPSEFVVRPTTLYKGTGIYIANAAVANPAVKPSSQLVKSGVEAFAVNANGQTVQIVGNSNMALGHGIFSYLDFLGYRFYFPNTDWHIIPVKPDLFRKWSIVSSPSFDHRRIWYGYGTGSKIADADYNFWVLANKLGGAMNASFGHSYGAIIARNRATFLKHPEWFYPHAFSDDGKFDMSNEDLVQFIIHDTEGEIEKSLKGKTSAYKMITLAPSDGPGTCNSPACQELGTYTDRVYYLINRVARAIRNKYPSTLIGCLAYGEYINPPAKKVEPNVFVGITTAFNSSKYSIEQLVDEWKKKGAITGIYDYFSWYAWDYDIPGQCVASKVTDMIKNMKKYYAKGVKAYEGESSIGWVSKGLGYYLAARQMWDIKSDAEAAKKEFFTLCFGKASGIMQKLWNEWENYSFAFVRETDLGRWIDYTSAAEKAEPDVRVKKRLFQVKSYLHYLFLYRNYRSEKTEASLLALLNFGYRKLDDGSIAGYPAFFELGNRSGIAGMSYDDKAKWRANSMPVSMEEMNRLMAEDKSKLKTEAAVTIFEPAKKFTNVPNLDRYKKLIDDNADTNNGYWHTNEWVIEIKNKGANNYIDFTGDYIGDTTNIKPFKISVYPYTVNGDISSQQKAMYYEYNKRKVKEKISLAQLEPGYYTVIIEDPVKIFQLAFSPSVNYSLVMRPTRQLKCTMLNYAFFYVPEGVKAFNVIKAGTVKLITPTGRKIDLTNNKPEDLQVQVQEGEAGLWRIKPLYDQLYLEGVPPYLGASPKQMLIPAGIK
ncbi:MAG: DUF4838 domain-containing protein [Bacteroidota bacterium]|nr:DUF4838 domain-containing protein [Bacteroidota bacterium]